MYYINSELETNRFDLARFCEFKEGVFDDLDSYFLDALLKLPLAGAYAIEGEAVRPDALSVNLYGSTQYWWILLVYNGMVSHEELTIGKTIFYPSLDQLETLYFELNSQEQGTTI